MNDQTQAVLDQVDARDLIDLASALIRIPSFKTEESEVALFLDRFFRERDYDVDLQEIEPGRLQTIATLRGTGGGASLMLNGHTDINSLTRRWRRDPWTPSLEGDRLYLSDGTVEYSHATDDGRELWRSQRNYYASGDGTQAVDVGAVAMIARGRRTFPWSRARTIQPLVGRE